MTEEIRQVGLRLVGHDQLEPREGIEVTGHVHALRLDRIHVLQEAEREEPADHAGDLQRELLRRGEPIDPVVDDPLEAIGNPHARQVDARRDPALAALDSEQAGLPQGQRKLLAVERIPLGFLEDQLLGGTGHRLDAEPFAGESQRILVRKVAEPEDLVGQLQQVLVLLGKGRDLNPRRDDQHRLARLSGYLQRQGPGGRVEPVGIVDHQERRPARRGPAQQAEQQVVGVVGPDLAGHRRGQLALGKIQRQDGTEERGQQPPLRILASPFRQEPVEARLVVASLDRFEQRLKDRPPGMVGARSLDRVRRADEGRDPRPSARSISSPIN